jgi:hypothetical protein
VFFGFWLSHVPLSRFESFWSLVRHLLKPNGRVFFVDTLAEQGVDTLPPQADASSESLASRQLNNGREFKVVKLIFDPQDLERRIRDLGWTATVRAVGDEFLVGECFVNGPG